jgi:4-amino-4-deoxy-L-arabinose transferase-like glycosyltransferase
MAEMAPVERPGRRGPALERWLTRLGEGNLLLAVIGVALVSHAYNMFRYPLYLGDEGIYLEQAWAVLREGRLSPYTYFYDHAPLGWLAIAWWVVLLPGKFLTFGTAINTGRVLMLLVHLVSVLLLFKITQRLSGSLVAAIITCLIFTLSPLALYYQRMVLLDNIMVFWILVSMYAIIYDGNRLVTLLGSAVAFALAVLSKENAVFFAPVLAYMIFHSVRRTYRFRFALTGWVVTSMLVLSFYPLYAFLKSELLPPGSFDPFGVAPAEHVSLLGTIVW